MNTKIKIKFALSALLLAALFFSCKKEQQAAVPEPVVSAYAINFIPAKTGSELIALRKDPKANLIRTVKEFETVVATYVTPLSKLSSTELSDFKKKIVVREGVGVVGLYLGVLQQKLSYDEFATVMSLFGLDIKQGYWGLSQDTAIMAKLSVEEDDSDEIVGNDGGKDYIGYLCGNVRTCMKAKDYICMASC